MLDTRDCAIRERIGVPATWWRDLHPVAIRFAITTESDRQPIAGFIGGSDRDGDVGHQLHGEGG